jgi:hypothetical protein
MTQVTIKVTNYTKLDSFLITAGTKRVHTIEKLALLRQYMKDKPVKFRIKMWVSADSAYCVNIDV